MQCVAIPSKKKSRILQLGGKGEEGVEKYLKKGDEKARTKKKGGERGKELSRFMVALYKHPQ